MVKKVRLAASEPSSGAVTARDTLQRLNYLYQASVLLGAIVPALPSRSRHGQSEQMVLPALSRMMVQTMRDVAKKAVVRMDPAVKRTLCKACATPLTPGLTGSIRIKPSGPHAHRICKRCNTCATRLSLPAPPHLIPTAASADDIHVDIVQVEKQQEPQLNKRERRERSQARKPVFFERPGHVTFAGEIRVIKDSRFG